MTKMTTIMGGRVQVNEDVVMLLGWPTDIVTIHSVQQHQSQVTVDSDRPTPRPHTLLLFVPGNPGCIGWYSSTLATLVDRLGPGFAAHGVSYAGHSPHPDRTTVVASSSSSSNHHHQHHQRRPIQVAWTIDGQVQHKIAFYDHVMNQYSSTTQQQNQQLLPNVIWLSHSIGAHLVERVLVLRNDCFKQTKGVLYLMPFVRMKADRKQDQRLLDAAAARPSLVISIAEGLLNYTISKLPMKWLESLPIMEEPKDQQLAVALLRQPWFARNFFQLGTEEIRDVSEGIDVPTLQYITRYCPVAMLYAGKDHWGPQFHVDELRQLQASGGILANTPYNLNVCYNPDLRHDYVSYTHMKEILADWCHEQIVAFQKMGPCNSTSTSPLRSKL